MIVPSVSPSGSRRRGVQERDLDSRGPRRSRCLALDVGVHGAADDRSGAHERDLDREVLEVLRDACAAAIPSARGSRSGRRRSCRASWITWKVSRSSKGMRERSIGSPSVAGDQLDAALDRGEHPQPEQVDLQKAGVGAGVLVPLHDLPALHRARARSGQQSISGARRDHHPAGVLGEMARQPVGLVGEARKPSPAAAARPLGPSAAPMSRATTPPGAPALRAPRDPLDLARGQAERLAELADRAARAVGGEGGDERRALVAVVLGDARDQPLADIAREVDVDVRQRGDVFVQEAADREVVRRSGRCARAP